MATTELNIQREVELEEEYTTQGILKSFEDFKKAFDNNRLADTREGSTLVKRLFDLVHEHMSDKLSHSWHKLSLEYGAAKLMDVVGTDVCTVIALREMLNTIPEISNINNINHVGSSDKNSTVVSFCNNVGREVELEWLQHYVEKISPAYNKVVLDNLNNSHTSSIWHRRTCFRTALRHLDMNEEDFKWTTQQRIKVGLLTLSALVSAGVMKIEKRIKGNRTVNYVSPEDIVIDCLEDLVSTLHASIQLPPMLVPPLNHEIDTILDGGSYYTPDLKAKAVGISTRTTKNNTYIREHISQQVLDSANRAAQTPYKFDMDVISKIREAACATVNKEEIVGIPSNKQIVPPAYPLPDNWDREDAKLMEIHKDWKSAAKWCYSEELKRKSKNLQFYSSLKFMERFVNDTVYFPTFFDWRGRIYYRPRVNPQGSDFIKGAIVFANKKALGERGLFWLKWQVATTYGYDKHTPELRVKWTDQHMQEIKMAVQHTVDDEWFCEADSPWCFYKAAKSLLDALSMDNPEEYMSDVPIAVDATCSGTQVLSALGLDEIGGHYINISHTDSDQKADIYMAAANKAMEAINKDNKHPIETAYFKEHNISRKMAKKPCMTLVYGSTLISSAEYVRAAMKAEGLDGMEDYSLYHLSTYAAKAIRKGIKAVVPSAVNLMDFLRECAKILPDTEALHWVSPSGFPVVNEYNQMEVHNIQCQGLNIKVSFAQYTNSTDSKRSQNGISPNMVHSLDASHLSYIINWFNDDIVCIHDSVASHACDMDRLNNVIREAFHYIYTTYRPLEKLAEYVNQFIDINSDKLNKKFKFYQKGKGMVVPPKGSLNLDDVLTNPFFYC